MIDHPTSNNPIMQVHLDLVSKIYDLPLHPERWQRVLDEFAQIMNAKIAGIAVHEPLTRDRQLNVMTSNFPSSLFEEYNTQISTINNSPYTRMAIHPKREFWTELKMLELENMDQYKVRPISRWLSKNFNVLHGAASCLNLDRAWTDVLLLLFPDNRGTITPNEIKIGNYFLDHFAKAMEINRSFSLLKSRFDGVLTALDRFHLGIFILSPNGSIILKNNEAERILAADDGLSLTRESRLLPKDEGRRAELKHAIAQAVSTAQANNNHSETIMTLPRKSGKDPYLVEISPFREDGEIESQFSGCLVFVIDPTKTDIVSTTGMRAIYNLTPSESEVCRLVAEGFATDDIADTRNITRETVRNYVKQILQKTGTRNRSQLVRLALAVNLPIDTAPKSTLLTSTNTFID